MSILTQGNESSEFFRFQWEFQWENDQKYKMAKNQFLGVQNGSQSVSMGVLGGVVVLKSALRILIRAPLVPFLVPPETPKMGHLPNSTVFVIIHWVSALIV